jgi:carbon storage regulator
MLWGMGGFWRPLPGYNDVVNKPNPGGDTVLFLNRKINESLMIGKNIRLTVVEISTNKIKIEISCPQEVLVVRQEAYEVLNRILQLFPDETRTREENAFLEAIVENPDDDGLRLIYCDWLEERGDQRGTIIRAMSEEKLL